MKFKVTTEHGSGRIFQSAVVVDEQGLRKILGQAASGQLTCLSFDSDTGAVVVIPAKVLETSIIEIIG